MDTVYLGHTGVRVSRLAFGTMSFGGDADSEESARLYAACRDAGVNLFDCADTYSQGRAEEILGKLIAHERDQVVLTSKFSFPAGPTPKDANACGASRYHLMRACEGSLKRLGTDRIDLYFVHRFDPRTELEETLRGLELLVQSGKILYPAVSNFAAYQTQRALDIAEREGWAKLVAIQPMYNLLKRQAEVELLPMAHDNRIAVLPYSPLAAGLLSGKYSGERAPSEGRMLTSKNYQVRYAATDARNVASGFLQIAERLGVPAAALAIAWVAAHPAVTAPLLGARNVKQLKVCLEAAAIRLDPGQYEEITQLSQAPAPATDRNDDGTEHDLWKR
jgi:aryl-alcohol dehydrogenase-like predicted oxidoreductase